MNRIHIALATKNIDAAVHFYTVLLGAPPSRTRADYAQFLADSPAVNLTLNATPNALSPALPAHYGIEVGSTDAVTEARARLESADMTVDVETAVKCCYSLQDKVWATDPDGHRWEVFYVHDRDQPSRAREPAAEVGQAEQGACCEPTCCT